MKIFGISLVACLIFLGCAQTPKKQSKPSNSQSIERAAKSFQKLDKETN